MQKFTPESIQALCEAMDSLARDFRAKHPDSTITDDELDYLVATAVSGDIDD